MDRQALDVDACAGESNVGLVDGRAGDFVFLLQTNLQLVNAGDEDCWLTAPPWWVARFPEKVQLVNTEDEDCW